MKLHVICAVAALFAVTGAGCSDESQNLNPSRLWLALDGSEVKVRLLAQEPKPY